MYHWDRRRTEDHPVAAVAQVKPSAVEIELVVGFEVGPENVLVQQQVEVVGIGLVPVGVESGVEPEAVVALASLLDAEVVEVHAELAHQAGVVRVHHHTLQTVGE